MSVLQLQVHQQDQPEVARAAAELRALLASVRDEPNGGAAADWLLERLETALADAESAASRRVARTITHELAQPLSEVLGYAELLGSRQLPSAQRDELLERIAAAARRLGELVHTIGRLGETGPPVAYRLHDEELVRLTPEPSPRTAVGDEPSAEDTPSEEPSSVMEARRALLKRLQAEGDE